MQTTRLRSLVVGICLSLCLPALADARLGRFVGGMGSDSWVSTAKGRGWVVVSETEGGATVSPPVLWTPRPGSSTA